MKQAIEPVEITVILKGAESSYRKKFLEYELCTMEKTDPIIKSLIENARSECKFEIEDVKIRASF